MRLIVLANAILASTVLVEGIPVADSNDAVSALAARDPRFKFPGFNPRPVELVDPIVSIAASGSGGAQAAQSGQAARRSAQSGEMHMGGGGSGHGGHGGRGGRHVGGAGAHGAHRGGHGGVHGGEFGLPHGGMSSPILMGAGADQHSGAPAITRRDPKGGSGGKGGSSSSPSSPSKGNNGDKGGSGILDWVDAATDAGDFACGFFDCSSHVANAAGAAAGGGAGASPVQATVMRSRGLFGRKDRDDRKDRERKEDRKDDRKDDKKEDQAKKQQQEDQKKKDAEEEKRKKQQQAEKEEKEKAQKEKDRKAQQEKDKTASTSTSSKPADKDTPTKSTSRWHIPSLDPEHIGNVIDGGQLICDVAGCSNSAQIALASQTASAEQVGSAAGESAVRPTPAPSRRDPAFASRKKSSKAATTDKPKETKSASQPASSSAPKPSSTSSAPSKSTSNAPTSSAGGDTDWAQWVGNGVDGAQLICDVAGCSNSAQVALASQTASAEAQASQSAAQTQPAARRHRRSPKFGGLGGKKGGGKTGGNNNNNNNNNNGNKGGDNGGTDWAQWAENGIGAAQLGCDIGGCSNGAQADLASQTAAANAQASATQPARRDPKFGRKSGKNGSPKTSNNGNKDNKDNNGGGTDWAQWVGNGVDGAQLACDVAGCSNGAQVDLASQTASAEAQASAQAAQPARRAIRGKPKKNNGGNDKPKNDKPTNDKPKNDKPKNDNNNSNNGGSGQDWAQWADNGINGASLICDAAGCSNSAQLQLASQTASADAQASADVAAQPAPTKRSPLVHWPGQPSSSFLTRPSFRIGTPVATPVIKDSSAVPRRGPAVSARAEDQEARFDTTLPTLVHTPVYSMEVCARDPMAAPCRAGLNGIY